MPECNDPMGALTGTGIVIGALAGDGNMGEDM
jgi:hypothetical protein